MRLHTKILFGCIWIPCEGKNSQTVSLMLERDFSPCIFHYPIDIVQPIVIFDEKKSQKETTFNLTLESNTLDVLNIA